MKLAIGVVARNRNYLMLNVVSMVVFVALRYLVTQLNHGVWAQESTYTGSSWSWLDVPALIVVTPIFVSALRFLAATSSPYHADMGQSVMGFPVFFVSLMLVGLVVHGGYLVVVVVLALIWVILALGTAIHVCMSLLGSEDSQDST